MLKLTVLTFVLILNFVSSTPAPQNKPPATTSNLAQDDDIFEYLFGWLYDYEDDDLSFDNKNITSEF